MVESEEPSHSAHGTMAILVGGGPAPGINGVIAAATIEAINCGARVIGLRDGFKWLAAGDASHAIELEIPEVSRIHFTGGSILRTSRVNPAHDEESLSRAIATLEWLGVRYLLCIGGDDTTYGAARIAERCAGKIGVATVPKTIDNDLPLPENAPTFGFETARSVGSAIVESLMEDARSTDRWYLAVTMGRTSGALALGMCKSSGATIAVIPEEFRGPRIDLRKVIETIAGAVIKRRAMGRNDGVAIIAEGIAERLDAATLPDLGNFERDAYGHVHLANIPVGSLLRDSLRTALKDLGIDVPIVAKDIGYELRCAKPVPFDVEYSRTLGYGAVRYLLGGGSGALIALAGGRVTPVALDTLRDPKTGRIRVRRIDVATESYRFARSYMIRLEPEDFEEPMLSRLAGTTKLKPDEFRARFLPSVITTLPPPA
ncbi:MAG: diphosphate--fructose-6-phosphate 1-phosphotransferase [Candidatus Binataceae bacterium]